MRRAALMPKIHRKLFSKFGGAAGVDDAEIKHYLVDDRALAGEAAFNATSARKLIKEYRATIKAAELSEIKQCSLPPAVFESDNDLSFFDFAAPRKTRPPRGSAPPGVIQTEDECIMEAASSRDLADFKMGPPREFRSVPRGIKNEHDERVLEEGVLSKTSKYRILVSGEIGQKEIELLIRRLEISKESLGRDKK